MKKLLYTLAAAALSAPAAQAQSVTLAFTPIVTGLSQPLDIVRAPSDTDRLFIVQKGGTVRIVKDGVLQTGSFLDISSLLPTNTATTEQGLLSLAFHPQHGANRMFWVVYNNTGGDLVLARYTTLAGDTNTADPTSATIVTTVAHPGQTNHNGGRILFGTDGYLYWSTGDGGGSGDPLNNAQTGSSRLGKMLRLAVETDAAAPHFTTPPTNPFIGTAGFDPLVYQYGLRNPFRWSFDRLTGDMWIGDVGQGSWEEVDYSPAATTAGRDWGWRCREGAHTFNTSGSCATGSYTGYTDPVYEYPRPGSGSSITGGYVYRGTAQPALYGRYVCVDYIFDDAFIVSPNGSGGFVGEVQTANIPADIAGFGENAAGELFAVSLSAGTMYAISATGTPLSVADALVLTHRTSDEGCALFSWNGNPSASSYALEWSADGRNFDAVSKTAAAPYEATLCGAELRAGYYRLRADERDGGVRYSAVLRLKAGASADFIRLSPNPLPPGEALRIQAMRSITGLSIRDLQGRVVVQRTEPMATAAGVLTLPAMPAGVYTVQATDATGAVQTLRLVVQ